MQYSLYLTTLHPPFIASYTIISSSAMVTHIDLRMLIPSVLGLSPGAVYEHLQYAHRHTPLYKCASMDYFLNSHDLVSLCLQLSISSDCKIISIRKQS